MQYYRTQYGMKGYTHLISQKAQYNTIRMTPEFIYVLSLRRSIAVCTGTAPVKCESL